MEKKDAMIILETGANKNNKLIPPNDGMKIGKENKMEMTENQQY